MSAFLPQKVLLLWSRPKRQTEVCFLTVSDKGEQYLWKRSVFIHTGTRLEMTHMFSFSSLPPRHASVSALGRCFSTLSTFKRCGFQLPEYCWLGKDGSWNPHLLKLTQLRNTALAHLFPLSVWKMQSLNSGWNWMRTVGFHFLSADKGEKIYIPRSIKITCLDQKLTKRCLLDKVVGREPAGDYQAKLCQATVRL